MTRERLKRDLELAHQVQLSFLPASVPQIPGYEFYAHYESALEVGGDYYGFIPLGGGRLAVTLGDVAGKGVPAALLMAKLSSDTRFSLLTEDDPAKAVNKFNKLLYEFTVKMDRFVTFLAALIDPVEHIVTVINAGHLSPLLCRKSGTLDSPITKRTPAQPLGIDDEAALLACGSIWSQATTLILYTDGIPDALERCAATSSV